MSATSLRPGDRRADQTRGISIVYEGLDRVDGSARFGFGATQALASVSGPIEVRPAQENPAQATLDVQIRPIAALPGTDAKALATTLKAIVSPALLLARNPRTLIQVVGQALSGAETGSGSGSAGRGWPASLTSSLVNATTAALVNAGSIPMCGVVCAVAVGRVNAGEGGQEATLVLDPEEAELPRLAGGGCFAFMFSSLLGGNAAHAGEGLASSLLWTNYTTAAPFDVAELARARKLAEMGARQVWLALRESVENMGSSKPLVKMEQQSQLPPSLSSMEVDEEKVEI